MTGHDAFRAARANQGLGLRQPPLLVAGVIALLAVFVWSWDAATQGPPGSPLIAADPEPNALLSAAPDRLSLTFADPIDPERTTLRLLRAGGGDVPLHSVEVIGAPPARGSAQPAGTLGASDYTVVWSTESAGGEILTGAYPFRIGSGAPPGAAPLEGEWPQPWAAISRGLVFLGASLAAGGFAWARLLASGLGSLARPIRPEAMAIGALAALLATALPFFLNRVLTPASAALPPLTQSLRAMSLGWWVQLVALFALALLCLGMLASGRTAARLPAALDWVGLGLGFAALVALSVTSHAFAPSRAPLDIDILALEIAHQWSTALWLSGLLYLAAGWRRLGSDVARFRSVRWIGGVLLVISILTGLARAWPRFPSFGDLLGSRYGQLLAAKGIIVLVILALGLLAMVIPRRSTAVRASRSLGAQGALAVCAVLLAAVLALMAPPSAVTRATLAGIELADVVPVDRAAFAAESTTIHLLTQPASPGDQTLVVRLTDGSGGAIALDPSPEVAVTWTPLSTDAGGVDPAVETTVLQSAPAGALFTGAVMVPTAGWWQADVIVTPPGGIASRARFWLVLPDPNVTGQGIDPADDPEARALYERGLESITSLRSVRYTQRLGDGGGSLYRSQTAVSAAEGERPATYADTIIDPAGNVIAQQTIIGDRRWILDGQDWVEAEPIPFLTPAAWGEAYADATGFQLGPREEVNGELSQIVTFWQPPRTSPSRAPAWFAWWIGLASGEVRREAMVSTRHYMVYEYSDFDASLDITPPVVVSTSESTAISQEATPIATPASGDQVPTP
ncbi:MAG: copper resistance protein CopC [Chloroflexi bacterium]|nr:copper resistance protein CopC [Chloroflexota bacterium]